MARVKLNSILQPVQDPAGNAISGATVQVNARGGGAATVYADESSGSTLTQPLATVRGRVDGWVDEGSYDATTTWKGQVEAEHFEAFQGATAAAAARKPSSDTTDAFKKQVQFVAEKNGDDTADGLSWGSPKKEIDAAIAALPQGGLIFVAPGSYRPITTLLLNGHAIIGQGPMGGQGVVNKTVTIQHNFNGDLIRFTGGGRIDGVYLVQQGNFTGAAIAGTSTTAARVGGIYLRDVTVTTGDGTNGFTRDLDLDGSADATAGGPGLRQVFVANCQFFGCKTTGETVRLNRVLHAYFSNCNIIQAPEGAVVQGLKVLDAVTDDIQWLGYVLGNVSVAAAGNNAFWMSGPGISGNLTFETGSANCRADCNVTGTATNNGSATANQVPLRNNTFAQPIAFDSEIVPNRIRLVERTDTGASAADSVTLFAKDVGGKTALMARFPSGAAVQVAIEP